MSYVLAIGLVIPNNLTTTFWAKLLGVVSVFYNIKLLAVALYFILISNLIIFFYYFKYHILVKGSLWISISTSQARGRVHAVCYLCI